MGPQRRVFALFLVAIDNRNPAGIAAFQIGLDQDHGAAVDGVNQCGDDIFRMQAGDEQALPLIVNASNPLILQGDLIQSY